VHQNKIFLIIFLSITILSSNIHTRIINGSSVEDINHKWNFIASFQDGNIHSCGATLLSPNWALTAGHCVIGEDGNLLSSVSETSILIDTYSLSSSRAKRYQIEKIVANPNYIPYTNDNDIALLKLAKTQIEINSFPKIEEVSLPAGKEAFVAGWGNTIGYPSYDVSYPDRLQEVLVPIVDWNVCNEAFYGKLTDNMICAGYLDGGKDSCQGDSGGPLVTYDNNGQSQLVGIVSWGDKCAEPNKTGIYTNVQNYIDWIESNTGELKPITVSSGDITKLYVATFNRAPDIDGIRYWVSKGLSLESISESFFDQVETKALYPIDKSVNDFIVAVYKNLFNREPKEDGLLYWSNQITSGSISRSVFILAVINGAKGDDITILENKQSVGEYFFNKDLNNVDDAKSVISGVDASYSSVTEAFSLIDNLVK
jgi:trypsin